MSSARGSRTSRTSRVLLATAAAAVGYFTVSSARATDVSSPVILQYFESKWSTMQRRVPDLFMAGYGALWTPPPGRALPTADGGQVGYDIYDRFDLGKAGDPTLYGTENGYRALINQVHAMDGNVFVDYVHHHVGTFDLAGYTGNPDAAGHMNSVYDYPGFKLSDVGQNNADTYADPPPDAQGTAQYEYEFRLAHLITLNQKQHTQYVRNPVPGFANNIPTSNQLNGIGRIANLPDNNNRRFYPDASLPGITVTDPANGGGTYTIHPFNNANPLNGTPVAEDVTGYMQRYAQWLIQSLGIDGLRIDAARHVPLGANGDPNVPALIDRAVYRASTRYNLDGTQRQVFSFQEVFNGDPNFLQSFIRKDINPSTPNVVGGNRDVLDFPLWFAMQSNLSSNGLNNNWYNIRNASQDAHDDGLANNGSQGVGFVINHDDGGVYLSNLAHAWVLTRPGNATVYFNAHEFDRSSEPNFFLKDGRGDALGGQYGTAITDLIDIRNTHGRGNFIERWIDSGSFSNIYAYERDRSMIVGLNSALGTTTNFDERDNVHTNFPQGTLLLELSGHAGDPTADPQNQIPKVITVGAGGLINLRIPRSENTSGVVHDKGYVIYGLAGPQGTLSIPDKTSTIAGETPTPATNATARLASIDVVRSSTFHLEMDTVAVNLLNNAALRDHNADGDNALFKVDGGLNLNGNAGVDFTNSDPTQAVVYGFEQFTTVHNPGYSSANNAGQYVQAIDTSKLSEGYHYITTRVFRHSDDASAPAVFSDFRKVIYVDLLAPNSATSGFAAITGGPSSTRTMSVRSTDQTADHVNVLMDLPATMSDAQVLAMVASGNLATQADAALFQRTISNVQSGNHTATVVTYEIDGNYSVQRFNAQQQSYLATSTNIGSGIGDLNADHTINSTDVNQLATVVQNNTTQFNPAADVNGDGVVYLADTFLMGPVLSAANVDANTASAFTAFINSPTVTSGTYTVNGTHSIFEDTAGATVVSAGSSLTATNVRGNTLAIGAGSDVIIRANASNSAGVSKVGLGMAGATNAWTGKLDLTNNDLVAKGGDLATITNQIKAGFAGFWNGATGITSSTAAGDVTHLTALGVILNNDGHGHPIYGSTTIYGPFDGQDAALNDVLIKYTYFGDADLNGQVDGGDYSMIDNGFNTRLTGWANGDFNYDGVIDGADYALIDNAFIDQASHGGNLGGEVSSALATSQVANVPEPTGVGLLMLTSLATVRRRDRRDLRQ